MTQLRQETLPALLPEGRRADLRPQSRHTWHCPYRGRRVSTGRTKLSIPMTCWRRAGQTNGASAGSGLRPEDRAMRDCACSPGRLVHADGPAMQTVTKRGSSAPWSVTSSRRTKRIARAGTRWRSPGTRIVSLTITEGGYGLEKRRPARQRLWFARRRAPAAAHGRHPAVYRAVMRQSAA